MMTRFRAANKMKSIDSPRETNETTTNVTTVVGLKTATDNKVIVNISMNTNAQTNNNHSVIPTVTLNIVAVVAVMVKITIQAMKEDFLLITHMHIQNKNTQK